MKCIKFFQSFLLKSAKGRISMQVTTYLPKGQSICLIFESHFACLTWRIVTGAWWLFRSGWQRKKKSFYLKPFPFQLTTLVISFWMFNSVKLTLPSGCSNKPFSLRFYYNLRISKNFFCHMTSKVHELLENWVVCLMLLQGENIFRWNNSSYLILEEDCSDIFVKAYLCQ